MKRAPNFPSTTLLEVSPSSSAPADAGRVCLAPSERLGPDTFNLLIPPRERNLADIQVASPSGFSFALAEPTDEMPPTKPLLALFAVREPGFSARWSAANPITGASTRVYRLSGVEPAATLSPPGPLPTIIVVNARKAGTSWLHRSLLRHPRIAGSFRKEICFQVPSSRRLFHLEQWVDRGSAQLGDLGQLSLVLDFAFADRTDKGWYRRMCGPAKPGSLVVDATPAYGATRT